MTKLFRRLRESMLKEGKIRTYLGYAVGEIILVVIGILLALQINNWNEERKDRQQEMVYYGKMLEDINQDLSSLNELIEDNEARILGSNDMMVLLQQSLPDRKAVVSAMRSSTARTTYTFKVNKAAFDDLKSSGRLSIIQDLALKNQLLRYYARMEGYTDVVDVNSDATVNMYYHPQKDFEELGWQDIESIRKEIDTTRVDLKALAAVHFPSPSLRKQLMSQAIFYVGTNVRKKELYLTMKTEIEKMMVVLENKCAGQI
jgi:hypothetical protein